MKFQTLAASESFTQRRRIGAGSLHPNSSVNEASENAKTGEDNEMWLNVPEKAGMGICTKIKVGITGFFEPMYVKKK